MAGVRVAQLPNEGFVVNPAQQQLENSRLDLVMAGTSDAVLMIEGFCDFLSNEEMVEVGLVSINNKLMHGRNF